MIEGEAMSAAWPQYLRESERGRKGVSAIEDNQDPIIVRSNMTGFRNLGGGRGKNTRSRWVVTLVVALCLLGFAWWTTVRLLGMNSLEAKAQAIRHGMSRKEVQRLLGGPGKGLFPAFMDGKHGPAE